MWYTRLISRWSNTKKVRAPKAPLCLEYLEDRNLLSTFLVDRLTDANPTGGGEGAGLAGDLRYAINQANSLAGDDIITFDVTGTISLARGLPSLSSDLDLQGPGANLLTVRGNLARNDGIFTVGSGTNITISGLTITSGHAQDGGGIFNSGVLTLNHSTLSGNRADDSGGGIFNVLGATLTLNHSTLSGNRAESEGGAIYNRNGSVTLNSSTVSGNEAMLEGGGIFNNTGATLALNHSTVRGNDAIQGGGLAIFGPFTARNTIIAGNTAIVGPDLDGHLGSLGHNLIGNSNGGTGYAPTDLLNVDPRLGPLQDNGGPTLTHALLPGSPALDAGDNTGAPATDQRGFPRIVGGTIDIGAFEVQPPPLTVTSFTATATGFLAQFSQAIDPTVLNLYDTQTGGLGPADVTLVGSTTGPVIGSLGVSADSRGITFIRTGGVLPADTYTATLRSAANGFRTPGGTLLDAPSITTFTVGPSSARVVSVADFMRGPGQTVDVPAGTAGLPLRLSDGVGVNAVGLSLRYNPDLLTISGFNPGPGIPPGAVTFTPGAGLVSLTINGPLGTGAVELGRLVARVPDNAPYAAKQVLDLFNVTTNLGPARDDDGIHVVGYFGDTTANAGYSAADAMRTLRVSVGLDTGFAAFQLADPVLIADITRNGTLNSTDATRILQELIGVDRPEIPPLPGVLPPIVPGGPDPVLQFPRKLRAKPGELVRVPLLLDRSDGLESVDLAIAYDTQRLEVVAVNRGRLTEDFNLFAGNVNRESGTIMVGLGRSEGPIDNRGSGSVMEILFRVKRDAPAGEAMVNLMQGLGSTRSQLNEGGLDLIPDPSDEAGDELDGAVIVGLSKRRVDTFFRQRG